MNELMKGTEEIRDNSSDICCNKISTVLKQWTRLYINSYRHTHSCFPGLSISLVCSQRVQR